MSFPKRLLWRIAGKIRDQLLALEATRQREIQQKLGKLTEQMQEVQRIQHKVTLCEARHWLAASEEVLKQLQRPLYEINHHLQDIQRSMENPKAAVPGLKDIYEELVQIEEEFDEIRYDRHEQFLSVTTEPIELEGVYLGPFEIQLDLPALSDSALWAPYHVVALDPHPPACNDVVTHPHVSDDGLCAGDGHAAIQTALVNGRICDFFQLVQSVLTHYNPGSPYVALSDWEGNPCYDCGYVMSGDHAYWCPWCEEHYCQECISGCDQCLETACRGCLQTCQVCDAYVCRDCMTSCPECGEPLCVKCLNDNRCPCLEEENPDHEESETETTQQGEEPTQAIPAVPEGATA